MRVLPQALADREFRLRLELTEHEARVRQDLQRRQFAGMLSALDEGVENVTAALRESSMLQETLWIVTTDNGGPTTECSTTGQSNWPFRGSKCSIWVREQQRALPTLSLLFP